MQSQHQVVFYILTWWFGGPRYSAPLPTDINLYIFQGEAECIFHEAKPSVILVIILYDLRQDYMKGQQQQK